MPILKLILVSKIVPWQGSVSQVSLRYVTLDCHLCSNFKCNLVVKMVSFVDLVIEMCFLVWLMRVRHWFEYRLCKELRRSHYLMSRWNYHDYGQRLKSWVGRGAITASVCDRMMTSPVNSPHKRTKASDTELRCFHWSPPEQTFQ